MKTGAELIADERTRQIAALGYDSAHDESECNDELIDCPLCGVTVKQVASATLSLALWQHYNWTCATRKAAEARLAQVEAALKEKDAEKRDYKFLEEGGR